MSIFLDLSSMFDVIGNIMGDIPSQVNRSIENPLITSLRGIPRDSMEEPEVEYFEAPPTESKDEFAECEVLS